MVNYIFADFSVFIRFFPIFLLFPTRICYYIILVLFKVNHTLVHEIGLCKVLAFKA